MSKKKAAKTSPPKTAGRTSKAKSPSTLPEAPGNATAANAGLRRIIPFYATMTPRRISLSAVRPSARTK